MVEHVQPLEQQAFDASVARCAAHTAPKRPLVQLTQQDTVTYHLCLPCRRRVVATLERHVQHDARYAVGTLPTLPPRWAANTVVTMSSRASSRVSQGGRLLKSNKLTNSAAWLSLRGCLETKPL